MSHDVSHDINSVSRGWLGYDKQSRNIKKIMLHVFPKLLICYTGHHTRLIQDWFASEVSTTFFCFIESYMETFVIWSEHLLLYDQVIYCLTRIFFVWSGHWIYDQNICDIIRIFVILSYHINIYIMSRTFVIWKKHLLYDKNICYINLDVCLDNKIRNSCNIRCSWCY